MMNKTFDAFLNGKLKITQPSNGYRAATDPVFLAASVPASSGQSVLDVGSGVGVASLCLGARVSNLRLYGIELQREYFLMSEHNAIENNINLKVVNANLNDLPADFRQKSFDHVMTNPPFFVTKTLSKPVAQGKSIANIENISLNDWISFSLKRLKSGGSFSIIHLTERLPEVLSSLSAYCGSISIKPISSRKSRPAKRIIVQGIKGSKGPMKLLEPFVVHDGDIHNSDKSDYSKSAKNILRFGHPLDL